MLSISYSFSYANEPVDIWNIEKKNVDKVSTISNLEESKNKVIFPLPVGSTIFSNNYFWLHGRKAFNEHTGLSRESLRIRGTFFN